MINLKCLNCAAALEISPDMTLFACGYCGSQQMVERKGGTVALKVMTDAINRVQVGTDKAAAELALKRLEKEVKELYDQQGHRIYLGHRELRWATQRVLRMGVVGLLIGVIFGVIIGGLLGVDGFTPILGLIGTVAGLAAGLYRKSQMDKIINDRMEKDLCVIDSHIDAVQLKIETNRRIADS